MPLRKILSSKINKFDGSFDEGCQNMSVPAELLTFISILIDGPSVDNINYSQPALTVSQLILSNFKQKTKSYLIKHIDVIKRIMRLQYKSIQVSKYMAQSDQGP